MDKKKLIVIRVEVPENILQIYLKTHNLEEIKKLIAEKGINSFLENSKNLGYKTQELESTW